MKLGNISYSTSTEIYSDFMWVYELEDMGYTGWEIVQEGSQTLNENNIKFVREIKETTNLQVTMHLPFSDMNLAGLNDNIRNEVLNQMYKCLDFGKDIVNLAVVHPGYLSPYSSKLPEKAWNTHIESIQQVCDYANQYHIVIALENMPDMPKIFGKYPDEMVKTLMEIDRDNLGMTLDVGHANTLGLIDEFFDQCSSQIIHMHIHDNHGIRDEHLPLGKGNIDWKKVIKYTKDYKGRFVTEMAGLEQGIECINYLKKI